MRTLEQKFPYKTETNIMFNHPKPLEIQRFQG